MATPGYEEKVFTYAQATPLEEDLHKTRRDELVSSKPRLIAKERRNEEGRKLDIASEQIDSPTLGSAIQLSKGSAGDSSSSQILPSYRHSPPTQQVIQNRSAPPLGSSEQNVYHENQELKKKVASLEEALEARCNLENENSRLRGELERLKKKDVSRENEISRLRGELERLRKDPSAATRLQGGGEHSPPQQEPGDHNLGSLTPEAPRQQVQDRGHSSSENMEGSTTAPLSTQVQATDGCQDSVRTKAVANLLSVSNVRGRCGVGCVGCSKVENECAVCGHPEKEHFRRMRILEQPYHKFQKVELKKSHEFSKAMMCLLFGGNDDVIVDATCAPERVISPSLCRRKLLCGVCENSTSAIEGRLCKRHTEGYYKAKPARVIHAEDVKNFCRYTYLSFHVNVNPMHFIIEIPWLESSNFTNMLKNLHSAFTSSDAPNLDINAHDEGMLFLYNDSLPFQYVEYAFPCKVNFTAIDPQLSSVWIMYAQMPPYFWAVPFDHYRARFLQPHFSKIINSINRELERLRSYYYKSYCSGETRQKQDTITLIVGLLRRVGKYYLEVTVHDIV